MIKLSDYLNYLNSEIVKARQKADEEAIKVAKEYAKHEYLRYFKVPRFSMPSVKLNVPLKITELNSDVKYNFKMDEESFLSEANEQILKTNEEKKTNLPLLKMESLKDPEFVKSVKKLEASDQKFTKNIGTSLNKIDFGKQAKKNIGLRINSNEFNTQANKIEELEMAEILKKTFMNRYNVVSANLTDVFIDPDTSKETDKGKILLTLDVEMVEEGIRIRTVKDKDGKEVEEIIFE